LAAVRQKGLSSLRQLKKNIIFPTSTNTDLINYIILANADFIEPDDVTNNEQVIKISMVSRTNKEA